MSGETVSTILPQDESIFARLAILRKPFPDSHINKLPRRACPKDEWDKLQKGTCKVCGGYHQTTKTIHLNYVGHAALTERLLDADPSWTWEPLAYDQVGLPAFDAHGGLWIKLTVCGVTRLGYGHAEKIPSKSMGDMIKEIIGDALRNGGMRFGCALDLWFKGDLHPEDDEPPKKMDKVEGKKELPPYSAAQVETNKALWEKSILAGKSSAEHIIGMISSSYKLSEDQKKIIRDIGKKDIPPFDENWLAAYQGDGNATNS